MRLLKFYQFLKKNYLIFLTSTAFPNIFESVFYGEIIVQNCANIKELDVAGADIVSGELTSYTNTVLIETTHTRPSIWKKVGVS